MGYGVVGSNPTVPTILQTKDLRSLGSFRKGAVFLNLSTAPPRFFAVSSSKELGLSLLSFEVQAETP